MRTINELPGYDFSTVWLLEPIFIPHSFALNDPYLLKKVQENIMFRAIELEAEIEQINREDGYEIIFK